MHFCQGFDCMASFYPRKMTTLLSSDIMYNPPDESRVHLDFDYTLIFGMFMLKAGSNPIYGKCGMYDAEGLQKYVRKKDYGLAEAKKIQ